MTDHGKPTLPGIKGRVLVIGSTESEKLFRAAHETAVKLREQGNEVTMVVWDDQPPVEPLELTLIHPRPMIDMDFFLKDQMNTTDNYNPRQGKSRKWKKKKR